MPGQALSIWLRRFPALVLTAALALVPANFVMAGLVVFGLGALTAVGEGDGATTHTQEMQDKHRGLTEGGDAQDGAHQRLARQAIEGETVIGPRLTALLPTLWSALAILVTLMAGVLLAQAALTPVLDSPGVGPAAAWGAAGARFGAIVGTAVQATVLTAIGLVLCVVPGIALAVGFAFAMPAVIREGVEGRAALERSFRLVRAEWPALLGWAALLVAIVASTSVAAGALFRHGLLRLAFASALRLLLLPLPLVGIALLHARALRQAGPVSGAAPR